MKIFLREITLKNYRQYLDTTISFTKADGNPYHFVCFYGPNGQGKSNLLEAISILTMHTFGRSKEAVIESIQKYVTDYEGIYDKYKKKAKPDMLIRGVYDMEGKEYVIEINQNGYIRNDFLPIFNDENEIITKSIFGDDYLKYYQRICHFIKTDSDLSFYKFQLVSDKAEIFEQILTELTGFETECVTIKGFSNEDNYYKTDCIFKKTIGKTIPFNCHFKQMSAGEKKCAKAFSEILNLIHGLETAKSNEIPLKGFPAILIYDNIEFHVYYKRHISFMNCLKKVFNQQQIFSTTHSKVLIERFEANEHDKDSELMIDISQLT